MRLAGNLLRYLCARALLAACLLACVVSVAPAQDQRALRGVAMVIGNSDYKNLPALPNPANDARAVEMLLNALGFQTELASDRDARRLQRDLDIFVEDAAGADVAVLYFAGHGIEAGGENFLVPVDADLSALDAADERLVPLSKYVRELQKTVPVTIILLDACRTNPFPPDAMVRLDGNAAPVAMATGGLGESRSAVSLRETTPAGGAAQNFGTVISFSAEPGAVALDGAPGENSPYAAAILRHLDIMAGEEFGTVMRMVAEEVFLKTAGRQRPWINESLRRLLYFGKPAEATAGVEGDILSERRKLLITISDLPTQGRQMVERVAGDNGVPMDALFAMLGKLGQRMPDDPKQLDVLLRRLADDVKRVLAERSALRTTDPEITRLKALAVEATSEGALMTAVSLWEQAKARVGELKEASIDGIEEDLRLRRIEFAQVYAGTAESKVLALDHLGAAADFELAAREVSRWDEALERGFLLKQAQALIDHGSIRGDTPALESAVRLLDDMQEQGNDAAFTQTVKLALADALAELGNRQTAADTLQRSVAVYRDLLDAPSFSATIDRGTLLRRLAGALANLGRREVGTVRLEEAAGVLEQALVLEPRGTAPLLWASIQMDLGQVRTDLWERGRDNTQMLEQAAGHFRTALEELGEDQTPALWAAAELGLARTLRAGAIRDGDGAENALAESRAAADAALRVCRRDAYPVCWASANHSRAVALYLQGARADDQTSLFSLFRQSMDAFGEAFEEKRLDMSPVDWAGTYASRADMLKKFADNSAAGIRVIYMAEAVRAYRQALDVINVRDLPALWGTFHSSIASILTEMGYTDDRADKATGYRQEAMRHRRAALEGVSRQSDPLLWVERKVAVAAAERLVAVNESPVNAGLLEQAIAGLREAIEASGGAGAGAARAYSDLGSILKLWNGDPLKLAAARQAYVDAWSNDAAYRTGFAGRSAQGNIDRIESDLSKITADQLEAAIPALRARLAAQEQPASQGKNRQDRIALAVLLKAQARGLNNAALADASAETFAAAFEGGMSPLQAGWLRLERAAALRYKADITDSAADIRTATDAYAEALATLPADDAPQAYSDASMERARMLADRLAPKENPVENYKAAVAGYRDALAHLEDDDFGAEAGTLNWNIADASLNAALYGAEASYAKAAADWYGAQMTDIQPDSRYFAGAKEKLAQALTELGNQTAEIEPLRQAATHYADAVAAYEREGKTIEAVYVRSNRGRALYLAGRVSIDASDFAAAAEELGRFIGAVPREQNPGGVTWAEEYLAASLASRAVIEGSDAAAATVLYDRLLAAASRETNEAYWAATTSNKAFTLALTGAKATSPAMLEEADRLALAAIEIFTRTADRTGEGYARLARCLALPQLAALRRDAVFAGVGMENCITARNLLEKQDDPFAAWVANKGTAEAERIVESMK